MGLAISLSRARKGKYRPVRGKLKPQAKRLQSAQDAARVRNSPDPSDPRKVPVGGLAKRTMRAPSGMDTGTITPGAGAGFKPFGGQGVAAPPGSQGSYANTNVNYASSSGQVAASGVPGQPKDPGFSSVDKSIRRRTPMAIDRFPATNRPNSLRNLLASASRRRAR